MCAPGGICTRLPRQGQLPDSGMQGCVSSQCPGSRIADRHVGSRARGAHERLLLLMRTVFMPGQSRGGMLPVSMLLERSAICATGPS